MEGRPQILLKKCWPLMNADEHRLKINLLSALIRVHLRQIYFSSISLAGSCNSYPVHPAFFAGPERLTQFAFEDFAGAGFR